MEGGEIQQDDATQNLVSGRNLSVRVRMYQTVCVSGETNRHSTVASGTSVLGSFISWECVGVVLGNRRQRKNPATENDG